MRPEKAGDNVFSLNGRKQEESVNGLATTCDQFLFFLPFVAPFGLKKKFVHICDQSTFQNDSKCFQLI